MPRPNLDERTYMRLVLITELHDVARKALAEAEVHAAAIAEDARITDAELQALWDNTAGLSQRLEFLGSSRIGLDLACRSLS